MKYCIDLIIIYDKISLKVSPTLSGSCKSDEIAYEVISRCGYVEHIATFIIRKEENEARKIKFISDRYEIYKKFT